MLRGAAWRGSRGLGYGRHEPRAVYLLGDGTWLLVFADSGLWFLESQTLDRRARLDTGAVSAVDVSKDGRRLAYADCASGDGATLKRCDLVVRRWPECHRGPGHRARIISAGR